VAVGLNGGQADTTVARMLPGRQLRRFREAADVTPEQAGHEIRASPSKISRMENGRVGFKARDVAGLLTLYGIHHRTDAGWWAR
jgi:predicted transcriptional regulator